MTKPQEPIRESIDAVVLAGSRGTEPFASGPNTRLPKPLLPLGGQPLVLRAVRAALGATGVGTVYVVGQPDALDRILGPLQARLPGRIEVVPEGQDILDNCRKAFFHHLLPGRGFAKAAGMELDAASISAFCAQHPESASTPVLWVTSDMPFVAPEDIERFLSQAPAGVALVAGLCDHSELGRMQRTLGSQTVLDRWKLGAIPLRHCDVRWNNLWLARPLMAEPSLYAMLGEIYTHRWMLDQSGRLLWRNWWAVVRAIARHTVRIRGKLRFVRGLVNCLGSAVAVALARILRRIGRWVAWPARQLVGQRDLEFWASLLLGAEIRVVISRNVAPAIDIDVEESYHALARDDEENYRRLARYLGRLSSEGGRERDRPDLKLIAGGKG